jgi:hypothetical protein
MFDITKFQHLYFKILNRTLLFSICAWQNYYLIIQVSDNRLIGVWAFLYTLKNNKVLLDNLGVGMKKNSDTEGTIYIFFLLR